MQDIQPTNWITGNDLALALASTFGGKNYKEMITKIKDGVKTKKVTGKTKTTTYYDFDAIMFNYRTFCNEQSQFKQDKFYIKMTKYGRK